jgi:ATP-dependent Lon protease
LKETSVDARSDCKLSHVVCQGVQRMRVLDFIPGTPSLTARALEIPEPASSSPEIEVRLLKKTAPAVDRPLDRTG